MRSKSMTKRSAADGSVASAETLLQFITNASVQIKTVLAAVEGHHQQQWPSRAAAHKATLPSRSPVPSPTPSMASNDSRFDQEVPCLSPRSCHPAMSGSRKRRHCYVDDGCGTDLNGYREKRTYRDKPIGLKATVSDKSCAEQDRWRMSPGVEDRSEELTEFEDQLYNTLTADAAGRGMKWGNGHMTNGYHVSQPAAPLRGDQQSIVDDAADNQTTTHHKKEILQASIDSYLRQRRLQQQHQQHMEFLVQQRLQMQMQYEFQQQKQRYEQQQQELTSWQCGIAQQQQHQHSDLDDLMSLLNDGDFADDNALTDYVINGKTIRS